MRMMALYCIYGLSYKTLSEWVSSEADEKPSDPSARRNAGC